MPQNLETGQKAIRFGERDTKASLLDLARRMLTVLYHAAHRSMLSAGRKSGVQLVSNRLSPCHPVLTLNSGSA
jgi:hypothetical protein